MFLKTHMLKYLLALIAFASAPHAMAQTTEAAKTEAPLNVIVFVFVAIALILAFVIWGLGNVLLTLTHEMIKKRKAVLPLTLLAVFVLPGFSSYGQDAEVVAAATNYGGLSATSFWILVAVLFIEIVAITFLVFMIRRVQAELQPQAEASESTLRAWWRKIDNRFFTKAVPVEREHDILIDHDYDGIRELDNSLPPWWKYGFYITIFASVIYLLHFHVLGSGKDPHQEYVFEMERAAAQVQAFQEKDPGKIDESDLKMPDAAGLAAGATIYNTSCWSCHGKQLEGGAGPNLTDNYWIHKGSLTDVYMSIKHGYPDKGMQAWEKNFSPKEINQLAGYIKSMAGSNPPNAKLPQGDLFIEEGGTTAADSTVAKDSTSITKKI